MERVERFAGVLGWIHIGRESATKRTASEIWARATALEAGFTPNVTRLEVEAAQPSTGASTQLLYSSILKIQFPSSIWTPKQTLSAFLSLARSLVTVYDIQIQPPYWRPVHSQPLRRSLWRLCAFYLSRTPIQETDNYNVHIHDWICHMSYFQ